MHRSAGVSAGDPKMCVSRLHLAVCVAAFALPGVVVALAGFTLSDGLAWFAAIPVSAVAGWYVGTHPDLVAAYWASCIGAGPVFW